MRKTIFVLLLLCYISLHATDKKAFEWIYNDDKSCSVYLEKTNTKDRKIFWSGKCSNKKINGYGILLLTGVKNGKREKLIQTKGLAHNGVMDGKVFLRWYNKYGTRGSYIIENDNIKVNSTAYFIYPDYYQIVKETFKENSKNQKKTFHKVDNTTAYKKAEELVYKHKNSFKNSLTECEYKTHNFKLNWYEHNLDGNPSYSKVLINLRDLFKCQIKNKQYKNLITITNDFLPQINDEEKKQFHIRVAEAIGISYYHLKDYKNSFNYFSKAKDFSYFKETKAILESKSIQARGEDKAKAIVKEMISNEITSATFLLSFSESEKSIKDVINKTKQKIDINSKNSDGKTILSVALKSAINIKNRDEKYRVLKYLLKNGGDVNYKYENNDTLLHMITSTSNDPKLIKLLIDNGGDVNAKLIAKDSNTITPLGFAIEKFSQAEKNHRELLALRSLNKTLDKLTSMLGVGDKESYEEIKEQKFEYRYPSFDAVKVFLNAGVKIDKNNPYLHNIEDLNLIKLLIKAGANVNATDSSGKTALFTQKKYEVNKLLIDSGANVSATDNNNETALFAHVRFKHAETDKIFKLLIRSGINVNVISNIGKHTILVNCIDNYEQVKLLIKFGIILDNIDNYNMTPLQWCDKYSKDKRVCILIRDAIKK